MKLSEFALGYLGFAYLAGQFSNDARRHLEQLVVSAKQTGSVLPPNIELAAANDYCSSYAVFFLVSIGVVIVMFPKLASLQPSVSGTAAKRTPARFFAACIVLLCMTFFAVHYATEFERLPLEQKSIGPAKALVLSLVGSFR